MIVETKEGLKILKGKDGIEALFIDSSRLRECIRYLYDNNLKNITINSFQGYKLKEIEFLGELKNFLEGLIIPEQHYDFSIINKLHLLKILGLPDNLKNTVDLTNFPNLERCSVTFSPRLKGLETCTKLKSLTLSDYKSSNADFSTFPTLPSLEELNLLEAKITSLRGIGKLKSLKIFTMYRIPKLEIIKHIVELKNSLEEIVIEKCKNIVDFDILKEMSNLKKIIISESGEIKSLDFVKGLKKLEFISFWGTNIIDGNISPCIGIPYVGFDNKKHYSHKNEQITSPF